ncbi:TonB-dependent receptor [Rheinheimera baltica]|uniref:TonB-dependent receptor n=1 Tax=Rheinheimera baltica TaxID=67576 RepID=A0ABT9I4U7_9GAMM|nr:TonB-dependent receptor [Rheinheimera baltica]MDP5138407.1 TonB-dependent receptor [Rheinheimera baltica]MDP5149517.1 TonB-dependent receptor [Rheinheimera baltica]
MSRKTILASLVSACLYVGAVSAESITGVVTDINGTPVAGATVRLMGDNQQVLTDALGRFNINNILSAEAELHIEAARFAHRNFHLTLPPKGRIDVSLVLLNSTIEVIDVKASPFHASATESSLPVSVLAGDALKIRQASTLGDTLKNEVGVHSNFYGGVTSSPIIRGLDGPRVLITQNGLDAGDASRVGPDHSVSAEASTATQIEVLRGPATLFYGSGAIGGVVNVVDERIPTDNSTRAEWMLQRDSVNNEKLAAGSVVTGVDNIGLYLDGFWRDNDSYTIPGFAEAQPDDDAVKGTVENTAATAKGFTLGGSYLLDNGYVGLSYGRLDREYGIPGHAHGDAHAEHDDDNHDGDEHAAEEGVYADLTQHRYQLLSELSFSSGLIRAVNTRMAFTDYKHSEIEAGVVGTTFSNQSTEARIEVLHRPYLDWRGGLSLHYKFSDFDAIGEEAFTPPSESDMLALAWMEERHFGPWLVQLGARIERVTIDATDVLLPDIGAHAHDDHAHDDHDAEVIRVFDVSQKFTPYSLSAGAVWDFAEGYNLGLSLSRSQRAPSASELLSFGAHIGTASYEVGALFTLEDDEFVLNSQPIEMEAANNLDITLRKFSGDTGFVLNAFYNHVDNYYYQQNTGLFAQSGHDHGEDDAADHDAHADELPVYLFTAADVTLHGLEAQFSWQINDPFKLTLQGDYIRARINDGGDLPRTPPLRFAAELAFEQDAISADVRATRYFKQDRTAALENATDGYTLLDASVSYRFDIATSQLTAYLKGQNLTDEEARVHTSFLKDLTPLPGRSVAIGIRGSF